MLEPWTPFCSTRLSDSLDDGLIPSSRTSDWRLTSEGARDTLTLAVHNPGLGVLVRIAADISCTRGARAGIGWYTALLLEHLAAVDATNRYILYTFYSRSRTFALDWEIVPSQRNVAFRESRLPFRIARFLLDRMNVPAQALVGPFDLFHSFDHAAPCIKMAKLVATVHDLAFLLYPERNFTNPDFAGGAAHRFTGMLHRADALIAVSHNTKRDLLHVLGIPDEKVHVIHEAADRIFRPLSDEAFLEEGRRRYGLTRPFILYVGTLEPRKNLGVLLRAFALLRSEAKIEQDLVLVGRKGWCWEDVLRLVDDLSLNGQVTLTGHVPREDLPLLYNLADLFVYPSLYEGFGLPPLEAMACGLPVVASNTSCFPEILGGAALLVDPQDVNGLARSMYSLLRDPAARRTYSQKGLERAGSFSWVRAARETLEVYRSVCPQES